MRLASFHIQDIEPFPQCTCDCTDCNGSQEGYKFLLYPVPRLSPGAKGDFLPLSRRPAAKADSKAAVKASHKLILNVTPVHRRPLAAHAPRCDRGSYSLWHSEPTRRSWCSPQHLKHAPMLVVGGLVWVERIHHSLAFVPAR